MQPRQVTVCGTSWPLIESLVKTWKRLGVKTNSSFLGMGWSLGSLCGRGSSSTTGQAQWLDWLLSVNFEDSALNGLCQNGLCLENLKNKFTPTSNISTYNARQIDDFEITRLRLEYCKQSFGYQGASTWNEIPKQIRDSSSLSSFKVRVREFLR